MDRRLYRPKEVAEVAGLSRPEVYALIQRGLLQAVRIGAAVRIPASELERLVTQGVVPQEVAE